MSDVKHNDNARMSYWPRFLALPCLSPLLLVYYPYTIGYCFSPLLLYLSLRFRLVVSPIIVLATLCPIMLNSTASNRASFQAVDSVVIRVVSHLLLELRTQA